MAAFGLSLFTVFIAPLIAVIAWIVSIIRLRSWFLAGATLVLGILILLTAVNPVFAVSGNPYVMLLLLALAIFNVLLLPYAEVRDKHYLTRANFILLVMIGALHAWATYLRQSDFYFFEQADYWQVAFPSIISLLSLSIPLIAIVIALNKEKGYRRGIILIVSAIVFGLIIGLLG